MEKAPGGQAPLGSLMLPRQYAPAGQGEHVPEPSDAAIVPAGQGVHEAVFPVPFVEYVPRAHSPPVEAAHASHPAVDICTTVHAAVIAPCVANEPASQEPEGALRPPAHHCPAVQGVHVLAFAAAENVPGGHGVGADEPSRQYEPAPQTPSHDAFVRRVIALPK